MKRLAACVGIFKAVKFRGIAKYQFRFPLDDPTRLISLATRIVAEVSLSVQLALYITLCPALALYERPQ
jgi:hypothetical protein